MINTVIEMQDNRGMKTGTSGNSSRLIGLLVLCFCLLWPGLGYSQVADLSPDSTYSLKYLQQELKRHTSQNNLSQVGLSHFLMGRHYERVLNTSDKALESYLRSLDIFLTLRDSASIFRSQLAIGNYYVRIQLNREAVQMYESALPFYHSEDDFKGLAYTYANLSDAYAALKNSESSEKYMQLALRASYSARDSVLEVKMGIRQSAKFRQGSEPDSARYYAIRSLSMSKHMNFRLGISEAEYEMGKINQQTGNVRAAIEYLRESLRHDPDSLFTFRRCETYRDLAECHYLLNEHSKAFEYLNQYNDLKDSLLNTQQLALIDQKAMEFGAGRMVEDIARLQGEQREATEQLTVQRIVIWVTCLLIAIAVLVGYYLVRVYRLRLEANQIILAQQEELNRRKISDLENNLKIETMNSMMQGQEAERERIARDLHDSLGGMLSTAKLQLNALGLRSRNAQKMDEYQKAYDLIDESCREVRTIAHQMQPNALTKLGLLPALNDMISKIHAAKGGPLVEFQHYGLDDLQPNPQVALTLYRIVQELLSNAIKHAQAKNILVQLGLHDGLLNITVEDDGQGFDTDTAARGMGLDNITHRVNYLKGDLSIHSIPEQGTSFFINIPLEVDVKGV